MKAPPPDIKAVLLEAARKWHVPYTVLAAIAFKESSYNPAARGTRGELGLMQLTAAIATAHGVKDRLDPQQSAMGAAQFLSELRAKVPDWHFIAAAYNAGEDVFSKRWPDSTVAYVQEVSNNRISLQQRAKPKHYPEPVLEDLDDAIRALATVNPDNAGAQALLQRWEKETHPNTALVSSPLLNNPDAPPWQRFALARKFRPLYAQVYDDAAITDTSTPPPWYLDVGFTVEVTAKAKAAADRLGNELGELGEFGAGIGIAAIAIAYMVTKNKR